MKQFFTSLLLVCAMGAYAQEFDWLTTLSCSETSKAQTNIQYVAYYADSSALVFGNFGSLKSSDLGLLGDKSYPGAEYGTASGYNKNFLLAKLDKSGNVLWAVHSEDGDVSDSQSAAAATSDGGAVLALKFRHSDRNKQDGVASPLYKIVDAKGVVYNRAMTYPGAWVNQPVLVRIDKDGKVTAVKNMWCSWEQAAKGDGLTTDAFSFSAAVEDRNGNIYISGSQSLNIALGTDTLYARPQPDWDGTTTNGRYNGFVLKLDKDLNYLAHIASEGKVETDKPTCMLIKGEKLYLTGLAKTETEGALKIGSKQTTVKELSIVNACLSTDLSVAWVAATPIVRYNNKQGNLLYQTMLSKDGSYIYATGGLQGAVELNGQTIHSGGESNSNMNDGYLFAFSTADGQLVKAIVYGSTTLNLNHGAAEANDSLYVYNYAFGDIRQVAYDRDLKRGAQRSIAQGGGSSTLVYTASLYGQVMLALRSKGGTNFTVMGNTENISGLWFNTMVAFHLNDDIPSGVQSVPTTVDSRKILQNGKIVILRNNKTYSIIGQQL